MSTKKEKPCCEKCEKHTFGYPDYGYWCKNKDCSCHQSESIEWYLTEDLPIQWKGQFRKKLADLDDLGKEHNLQEPIKGDIYFDGIEIEAFIDDIVSQAITTAVAKRELEIAEEVEKKSFRGFAPYEQDYLIKKEDVLSTLKH